MFEFVKREKIDKAEYKKRMKELRVGLGRLQRRAVDEGVPVLVILEGMDGAGKGGVINELLANIDPRGYRVYSNNKNTHEEKLRPPMWKFWNELPKKGEITIFDRSWYYSNLKKNGTTPREIEETERLLVDDGMLIVKIFLYVSKEVQGKRLKDLEENLSTSWKVGKKDWKHHHNYSSIQKKYDELIEKTSSNISRWNIVSSDDIRNAKLRSFEILVAEMVERLDTKRVEEKVRLERSKDRFKLSSIALEKGIDAKAYKAELKIYQERLRELEHEIYEKRIPVVIAYEGWDAAGKGGNIKRMVAKMDPRGYDVIPISAPSDLERSHHYLWRFWKELPKGGHIGIFDRTWYGRVLVERVEGFCSKNQWKRAYSEIASMEKQWTDRGVVVIKFWIHIDMEKQLERFNEREESNDKSWKITDEDWRNRQRWQEYTRAVEDMVEYTSTKESPWHIIEGNSKMYARLKTMKIVIKALEEAIHKVR